MDDALVFWVALTRIDGLGIRGSHKLIEHFGTPQAAYMASLTELESYGLPARVAQAIFAQACLKEAETSIRRESIDCRPEAVPCVRLWEASECRQHKIRRAITTRSDATIVDEAM